MGFYIIYFILKLIFSRFRLVAIENIENILALPLDSQLAELQLTTYYTRFPLRYTGPTLD